jgi:uncharacterized protein YdiU (UPF0061 family)
MSSPLPFDNSYSRLPERFYARLEPTPVTEPAPICVNRPLALRLGIDPDCLAGPTGTRIVAGNELPAGADPIATVYAGHQFGSWNPQLGYGRAILLGELLDCDGQRYDIQLKGSGRTPYSRGGDGRSPLGPVLREYIVSEAMAVLGIPTTRALAAVSTGERVIRESALPGAVLARVASSHIRVGTFQFFASRQDNDGLRLLAEHVIGRHYPQASEAENPVLALLTTVIDRLAGLVAQWQLVGFIHGVMNTDNMLLSGETIDYGPCAFMEHFDPDTVFSSIDHAGRYAYRNQPAIAHWNLACLAQALLPILHEDAEQAVALAQAAVDRFPDAFQAAHDAGMARKLGLPDWREADGALTQDLLQLMTSEKTDFTLTFRRLADLAAPNPPNPVAALFELPPAFTSWLDRWRDRLADDPRPPAARQAAMYRANPVFIPRNHRVEAAIDAAVRDDNLQPFRDLVDLLQNPFDFDPARADHALPAAPDEAVLQTFCGT